MALSENVRGRRSSAADLLGQTIDNRYAIFDLIAHGRHSIIYKAEDRQLRRDVALKVIIAPKAAMTELDEDRVRRFKREGKGLAQMNHPNIVAVFDTGIDGETLPNCDLCYIAMVLMEGETLAERLKRLDDWGERMAWSDVLNIIQDIASALDYAHNHELRFVHRDVTPSNIMLAGDQAYLFDFGLMKALGLAISDIERETFAEFRECTIEGLVLGTPAYWSPEQILEGEVDHRADIYAMGGVLYRMITGQLPYEGKDPFAISHRHLNDPPPQPGNLDQALRPFDPIVTQAMAKDPDDRYQSAGELAQALEKALTLTPDYDRGQALAAAQRTANRILWGLGRLLALLAVAALVLVVGTRRLNWFQPTTSLPPGWQSSPMGVIMMIDGNDFLVSVAEGNTSYTVVGEGEMLKSPNVSLEVDLESGPQETAYGLVFHQVDDSNYFTFATTGAGQFGVWQRKADRWIVHTPGDQAWATQQYIYIDRPNLLEVTIEGDIARGWINSHPAFEMMLGETQPGYVGFFVSTSRESKEPQATIRFTNFKVRK